MGESPSDQVGNGFGCSHIFSCPFATPLQAELIRAIDASSPGGGLTTALVWSWVGQGAELELTGRWQGGLDARRAAMLAIYQV